MSLDVFGGNGALEAFDEPAPEDREDFTLRDHVGGTVVVTVHGPKQQTTKYGEKTAIACDVVTVADGKEYEDVLIFASAIVSQLKKMAGRTMAATIETYSTDYGTDGYRFVTPDAKALAAAQAIVDKK